jgi:hypothetical protein
MISSFGDRISLLEWKKNFEELHVGSALIPRSLESVNDLL